MSLFWLHLEWCQARGVADSAHRQKLIAAADEVETSTPFEAGEAHAGLPGVNDLWQMDQAASASPQVECCAPKLK